MALNSIRNVRGFFSDYWLGSILSAKKGVSSKLTKAQAEKILWRLTQLRDRIEGFENLDLTRFREQFARPLLGQVFGFNILEHPEETRVRVLTRQMTMKSKAGSPEARWSDFLPNRGWATVLSSLRLRFAWSGELETGQKERLSTSR
jgi:hypothetical protein